MRIAAGIALILLGMIGLAICGIVFLHLALPAPEWLHRHLRTFGFLLHPIEGPLSSIVSLMLGVFLVRGKKITPVW
jgi:hypothetical protein